jgi:hypothetical protein
MRKLFLQLELPILTKDVSDCILKLVLMVLYKRFLSLVLVVEHTSIELVLTYELWFVHFNLLSILLDMLSVCLLDGMAVALLLNERLLLLVLRYQGTHLEVLLLLVLNYNVSILVL